MPEIETRYPCPVCLGVAMEKVVVGEGGALQIDHCTRCGGAWFELGEVQRLRRVRPEDLWARIAPRGEVHRAHCHACHTPVQRSEPACPACGHTNLLDCPVCQHPMRAVPHDGLRLDACTRCKGVWFDHHELAAIWKLELDAALDRRRHKGALARSGDGAFALVDVLAWHPGLVFYGVDAAGHAVIAGASALGNAPEAAGAVVEMAGEAAAGVFETIVEIISGFFN